MTLKLMLWIIEEFQVCVFDSLNRVIRKRNYELSYSFGVSHEIIISLVISTERITMIRMSASRKVCVQKRYIVGSLLKISLFVYLFENR